MSTGIISRLHEWPRYCLPKARKIALDVIKANPPLSTQDIFRLVNGNTAAQPSSSQVTATGTRPPHPFTKCRGVKPPCAGSQIRSVRYLKKIVLPSLASDKEIEKFHTKVETKHSRTADVWLWRAKDRKKSAQPQQQAATGNKVEALPAEIADLPPAAVGVGEDWSHLNRRRQRARERKVERDLKWMRTLQNAKREAVQEFLAEKVPSVSLGMPSSRSSR